MCDWTVDGDKGDTVIFHLVPSSGQILNLLIIFYAHDVMWFYFISTETRICIMHLYKNPFVRLVKDADFDYGICFFF